MQESIRICRDFAREMRINVWFRQGGYLFLVRSEEGRRTLEKSVARAERLRPRHADADAQGGAARSCPSSSLEGVVAASYNPEDGVVFPWPFVWGYAQGAEKLGRRHRHVHRRHGLPHHRQAHRRRRSPTRARSGRTASSTPPAPGARRSPACSASSCPNHPHRHEICSTEPLKLWLKPAGRGPLERALLLPVDARRDRRRHRQRGRAARARHGVVAPRSSRSTARRSSRRARSSAASRCCASGRAATTSTPDANPIVGEVDEVEGFYQASGFMGHGFMMAPVMGRILARHIAEGTRPADVRALEPAAVQGGAAPVGGDDHRLKVRIRTPLPGRPSDPGSPPPCRPG